MLCLAVGGNHEAANYLWELYYGGWAAPNIYFLGFSGGVKFGGLRIAGLSGIFKQACLWQCSHCGHAAPVAAEQLLGQAMCCKSNNSYTRLSTEKWLFHDE